MSIIQSIVLGIIQGITEFLPISSSAHLVLAPYLFGWEFSENQNFIFGVLVQMGTLVAVILYFWRDLASIAVCFVQALVKRQPFRDPQAVLGWLLILATVPAGLFGLFVKDSIEAAFSSPIATAVFLFITAGLLVVSEIIGKRTRGMASIGWKDALLMGAFQALAVFPGISRSGSTITGGMLRNLDRPSAARFSFLMSIPVMIAAGLLATLDMFSVGIAAESLPVFLPGIVAAALVGYGSIHWLLRFLSRSPMYVFSGYCIILALAVLFFAYGSPEERAVQPAGEVYRVEIMPEVAYLEADLRTCAEKYPQAAVFPEIKALPSTETSDLVFSLGEPASLPAFAAPIKYEKMAIIVHPENDTERLSVEQLRGIYTGSLESWDQIGSVVGSISVWTYPDESPAARFFEQEILNGAALTGYAYIAPGPEAMIEAVSQDPRAIGIVPASIIDGRVRAVELRMGTEESVSMPVLALSKGTPEGSLREIVACMQEG